MVVAVLNGAIRSKDPKAMFDSCYAQNVKMVGLHIRSILDNGPEYHLLDKAREQGNVHVQEQR